MPTGFEQIGQYFCQLGGLIPRKEGKGKEKEKGKTQETHNEKKKQRKRAKPGTNKKFKGKDRKGNRWIKLHRTAQINAT